MVKKKKQNNEEVKVKYTVLNNKSRKGEYAYVKQKGKRGAYYKVKPEIGKDDKSYKVIYRSGGVRGRKGVTKERTRLLKKVNVLVSEYPDIDKTLPKGFSETEIPNAYKLTPYEIKNKYKELLFNVGKKGLPSEILELLVLPESIEKWKHRVLYKVNAYNQNGDLLVSITPDGTIKTLSDIQKEVLGTIVLGAEYKNQYKRISESVESKGYRVLKGGIGEGRVTNVKILMSFRKG